MSDQLMSARTLAEYTDLSESTIRHWTSNNRIPFIRIRLPGNSAGAVRYRRSEIDAWLEQFVVPAGGMTGKGT